MKNQDVADTYAQGDEKIKTKHLFIEGKAIYSYGYHFPIAFKLSESNILFNSDGYSNTTVRHKGRVKRALESNGFKLIFTSTQSIKKAIENDIKTMEEFNLLQSPQEELLSH